MDVAKAACSVMGAFAFGINFVPRPVRHKLEECVRGLWERFFSRADPFAYIEVPLKRQSGSVESVHPVLAENLNDPRMHNVARDTNPFYEDVSLYLGSLDIEFKTKRVSVYGAGDDGAHSASRFSFGLPINETLEDTFDGSQLWWSHAIVSNGERPSSSNGASEDSDRVFTLTMLKSEKLRLLRPYLHHISTVASEIRHRNTLRTLYRNSQRGSYWSPVTFKHPSTFDTIALEGNLGERIQADLKAFSESEKFYHNIGRAWKRGYLLYGPPGTGKSSLIAAIANFMQYDVYDLELSNVFDNSQLKNLLLQTKRKSIIVIEDIDCSMDRDLPERKQDGDATLLQENEDKHSDWLSWKYRPPHVRKPGQGLTLSGLLNFSDGLLSCFGEERIFIFTTNHKERLDSALLRSGRMDMHILLSYCTFLAFKKLAFNYLGIQDHALYGELEKAMKPGVKITPASVAEILISKKKDPNTAIEQVVAAVSAAEKLDSRDNQVRGLGWEDSEESSGEGEEVRQKAHEFGKEDEATSRMIGSNNRQRVGKAIKQQKESLSGIFGNENITFA